MKLHETSLVLWKPPRVFMAMGRKAIPWAWQGSHVKFVMSELNHENLNGAVILWKFNINDILSHTLVSAYEFCPGKIHTTYLSSFLHRQNFWRSWQIWGMAEYCPTFHLTCVRPQTSVTSAVRFVCHYRQLCKIFASGVFSRKQHILPLN